MTQIAKNISQFLPQNYKQSLMQFFTIISYKLHS